MRKRGVQYAEEEQRAIANNFRRNEVAVQRGNDTQWWLYLLVRVKANDVKNNIHRNVEC